MPVEPRDKPLDALREETIDELIMNYGHGELSLEAFERRLDEALAAANHETLVALVADLDLRVDKAYITEKKRELGLYDDSPKGRGSVEYLVSVFSGTERTGPWEVPAELRVVTVFGGTDIDFSDARLSSGTTRIRLLCVFGGVDIAVREGINTTVKAFCIFGGVGNRTPTSDDPHAPKLVIEGLVLFGGADVKVKKTLKQRLREFADSLRSMFGQRPEPRRE